MTARPLRSTTRVVGAVCATISASGPTAMIRSPAIAIACAIVKPLSTVMIFPFLRTRSAGRATGDAGNACACACTGMTVPSDAPAAAFRNSRRPVMPARSSLHLNAGGLHDSLPLAALRGNELGKFRRRHRRRHGADLVQAFLHLRLLEDPLHLARQCLDDRTRRPGRREQAVP